MFAVLGVLTFLASPSLHAQGRGPGARPVGADGVVQIDQQAARVGGISEGDEPGFPVTISEPGSYRLTSNLSLTAAGASHLTDAIRITVDGVTLDLNGFEISGHNACTGLPPEEEVTCTYLGIFTGSGIQAFRSATIRNGAIRGMTNAAVLCHEGCTIEDLRVRESLVGIHAGGRSVIRGCAAERNGGTGISTNLGRTGSTVENNVAFANGGAGFFLGNGDSARGNSATRNGGDGIFSNGGTLVNNSAHVNGAGGIRILRGTVLENSLWGNREFGLLGGRGVAYGANTIVTTRSAFPASTTVLGAAQQIGTNLCGDESDPADPPAPTCP